MSDNTPIEHLELWRFEKREEERDAAEAKAEAKQEEEAERLRCMALARADYDAEKHGWAQEQDDCDHPEHDHGICLHCGKDIMDDIIDRAELMRDSMEDR